MIQARGFVQESLNQLCVFYNKCDEDQGFSSGAPCFFPGSVWGNSVSRGRSKVNSFALCRLPLGLRVQTSLEELSRKPSSHILQVSPAEAFGQHYRCAVLVTSAFRAWKTRANEPGRFSAKPCVFANTFHSIFSPGIHLWRESPIFQCWWPLSELLFWCLGHTVAPEVPWYGVVKRGLRNLPGLHDCQDSLLLVLPARLDCLFGMDQVRTGRGLKEESCEKTYRSQEQ